MVVPAPADHREGAGILRPAPRGVLQFFARSWIPDETFSRLSCPMSCRARKSGSRTLTYLVFSDYGMPVTFYNDQYDLLIGQGSPVRPQDQPPEALGLRARLGALWAATGVHFPNSNEATGLFRFLTGRGRVGRRFGQRFWEAESSLGATIRCCWWWPRNGMSPSG